jgi:hypothetical protein
MTKLNWFDYLITAMCCNFLCIQFLSSINIVSGKLRTVKVKQNSGECFSFFISFNEGRSIKSENGNEVPQLARAISIHPFSKKTFMVLDSAGDLHFFNLLSNSVTGPNSRSNMAAARDSCTTRLDVAITVQLLAVRPNFSTSMHFFYCSLCEIYNSILPSNF